MAQTSIRPFLKWPGGKFRLVGLLKSQLEEKKILVEPFAGAGALFLNTTHRAIINDLNPDLMNFYKHLQQMGQAFIDEAKTLFDKKHNQSKIYYQIRSKFNKSTHAKERALFFLYLNRHGYNGLCRYNLKGHYNVPFGDYVCPYFPEKELQFGYSRLQSVTLNCQHYLTFMESLLKKELSNTLIYCDPPYAPLSKTANFTGYAAAKFTLDDQKELAQMAKTLAQNGAKVLLSNHDTPFTRAIYKGAKIKKIEVSRTISCQTTNRKPVKELIALYQFS